MAAAYWLIKSEPFKYPWSKLSSDGRTAWDGVRNFEARNHLRAMRVGDLALFYHSTEGKEVVGVARVIAPAYPDPTVEEGDEAGEDWSAVDFEPAFPLARPVPLALVKSTPALAGMGLIRRSRLSVTPVTPAEFKAILALGKTRLPTRKR